mmetsp:Transcript_3993/g.9824  ORF Transcript_3993/g.9824 Transcript_3993/m.9824 type:complete len:234 (+) Transcript_3993:37-738(+)
MRIRQAVRPIKLPLNEDAADVAANDSNRIGYAGGGQRELAERLVLYVVGDERERPDVDRATQQPGNETRDQQTPVVPILPLRGGPEEDQEDDLEARHQPQRLASNFEQHARRARHEHPTLVAPVGKLVEPLSGVLICDRETDGGPRSGLHGILGEVHQKQGNHVRPEGQHSQEPTLSCRGYIPFSVRTSVDFDKVFIRGLFVVVSALLLFCVPTLTLGGSIHLQQLEVVTSSF